MRLHEKSTGTAHGAEKNRSIYSYVTITHMQARIIRKKISKEELKEILQENFEDMVKVDVDVLRSILSIGGEWHSEGDEMLNKDGS